MARPKPTINTVDLTRAIKAVKAAGLTISYTKFDPDGTVTLIHLPELPASASVSGDDALAIWEAKRSSARLA